MKKWIYIIGAVLIAALIAAFIGLGVSLKRARAERDRYHRNSDALLAEVETYKTKDSLSVARAQGLELKLSEYKRFRADDAKLISSLKTKIRDLDRVTKTQAATIYELQAVPVDTVIVYRDTGGVVEVPARRVHCGDAWYDFDGIITEKSFTGQMQSRDSLMIAQSVKYKRFLGFLWRTKKIKSQTVEVVSKNPHTAIVGAEMVSIVK